MDRTDRYRYFYEQLVSNDYRDVFIYVFDHNRKNDI